MKLEVLSNALNSRPPSRWRDAALLALSKENFTFAGASESGATASVHELIQTYRPRLEHTRKHGIDAIGIEELLEVLIQQPANTHLRGTPFLGANGLVYAFWDENDALIGCVT